jgi:hypothetical protein
MVSLSSCSQAPSLPSGFRREILRRVLMMPIQIQCIRASTHSPNRVRVDDTLSKLQRHDTLANWVNHRHIHVFPPFSVSQKCGGLERPYTTVLFAHCRHRRQEWWIQSHGDSKSEFKHLHYSLSSHKFFDSFCTRVIGSLTSIH